MASCASPASPSGGSICPPLLRKAPARAIRLRSAGAVASTTTGAVAGSRRRLQGEDRHARERVHRRHQLLEGEAALVRQRIIGGEGGGGAAQIGRAEIGAVIDRLPVREIGRDGRVVAGHLDQHEDFAVMVQVIVREAGRGRRTSAAGRVGGAIGQGARRRGVVGLGREGGFTRHGWSRDSAQSPTSHISKWLTQTPSCTEIWVVVVF